MCLIVVGALGTTRAIKRKIGQRWFLQRFFWWSEFLLGMHEGKKKNECGESHQPNFVALRLSSFYSVCAGYVCNIVHK